MGAEYKSITEGSETCIVDGLGVGSGKPRVLTGAGLAGFSAALLGRGASTNNALRVACSLF